MILPLWPLLYFWFFYSYRHFSKSQAVNTTQYAHQNHKKPDRISTNPLQDDRQKY